MIQFDSSKHSEFEVVVIGGGPGGLSAATWCVELGMSTLLIESNDELGGQLSWIHNPIMNHLGGVFGNGSDLREVMLKQVAERDFVLALGRKVDQINHGSVTLSDGGAIRFKHLIMATGLSRRTIGIDAERVLVGKGILSSGAGQRESVTGKTVAVIGGGDAAVENALILSEFAEKTFLIHRREKFVARDEMVSQLQSRKNIDVLLNKTVKSIEGHDVLSSIIIEDVNNRELTSLAVENLLIRIGFEPNSSLLEGKVEVDEKKYIKVDSTFRSSDPSIYAIGDVVSPMSPTISGAVGAGSIAAKSIHFRLNN
jgi:thioredoxin reductase (NADPH)